MNKTDNYLDKHRKRDSLVKEHFKALDFNK
jgi:hypothetical protein